MEVTKPIKVGNVWTNLISGATGESVNYEEVTQWYDGTPMDDSKADGEVYRKLPSSVGGGYVRRVYDNFGQLFLEKDNVTSFRNMSSSEELLLLIGRYAGVRLGGYYQKGDTPRPLEYNLESFGTYIDDGGAVLETSGGLILKHNFTGEILHDSYYGYIQGFAFSPEENVDRLNAIYSQGASEIVHTKDLIVEVNDTVSVTSGGCHIIGNGFTIKQSDQSGMIVSRNPLFTIDAPNVVIEGLIFDDNIANNYIIAPDEIIIVHAAAGGQVPGVSTIGHDVVVIRESFVVFRKCEVIGASWSAIKTHIKIDGGTRPSNILIEGNIISQSFRDAIPVMHTIDSIVRDNYISFTPHHGIHVYRNTQNTLIEGNIFYNDVDEIFEWYSGFSANSGERSAMVVDHINYSDKTVNTTLLNNSVNCAITPTRGYNYGVVSQGYPDQLKITGNDIKNVSNGIFISRGNPTLLQVSNNNIRGVSRGIRIYPAATNNVGGKDTPQQSNISIFGNTIDAIEYAVETTGTANLIQTYYDFYYLVIENNSIIGNPQYTFYNSINFSSGLTGGTWEIYYRNNTETVGSKLFNAQNVANAYKGNSLVWVDKIYPVPVSHPDLVVHGGAVAGQYVKIFELSTSGPRTITGTIRVTERRGTMNVAELNISIVGASDRRYYLKYISQNSSPTFNNFQPSNFVFQEDSSTGVLVLYMRSNQSTRDYVVDFKDFHPNQNIGTELVINTETQWGALPSGGSLTNTNPIYRDSNPSDFVAQVAATNASSDSASSASTVGELVTDFNDLITKYNSVVTLVNELKSKLNASLQTEIDAGKRWGS